MARVRKDAVNVGIQPDLHERVSGLASSRGMNLKTFLERFIQWILGLDDSERTIILRQISEEDVPAIARLILERQGRSDADELDREAAAEAKRSKPGRNRAAG